MLRTTKDFTIDQLIKHIYIEEKAHIHENNYAIKIDTKVNYVESKKIGNGFQKCGKKGKHEEVS